MDIIHIIGQILFGGFFVISGFSHFKNHKSMVGYATMMKVPAPGLAVFGSGVLLFLGGLSVLFYGVIPAMWTEIGFIFLIIFLVPTTLTMHAFWNVTDPQARQMNRIQFMKNVALLGAILSMIYW